MGAPSILDFDTLLKPIPGEKPAGESVRYSGVYDSIQEARREDFAFAMGDWSRDVKAADWNTVIELASATISEKSKDLQVAIWLTEALLKKYGTNGLRDSFHLLRELQENFWAGLFPEVEQGDLEPRAGALQWLNEKLPPLVLQIALTEGEVPYSWHHWDESRKVDNLGRQNADALQAAIKDGKITGEQFDKATEATPRQFYEALFVALDESKSELNALEKSVDEKFGRDAPSLIAVRNAVDDCHGLVLGILKKKREQDPTYRPEPSAQTGEVAPEPAVSSPLRQSASNGWSGEPRTREEAFQRLDAIAAYLRRTEPQHPVSYLLERAVRWTKMPLEQWLGEVIQNDDVLKRLRETLGIQGQT
jgi:type VI secretion system protein ImpA